MKAFKLLADLLATEGNTSFGNDDQNVSMKSFPIGTNL